MTIVQFLGATKADMKMVNDAQQDADALIRKLRKRATIGCEHQVREGLVRPSYDRGVHGQELADGTFCWRCRRRQASGHSKLPAKKVTSSVVFQHVYHHQNSRRFKCTCGRVHEWCRYEGGTPERDFSCECGRRHWR